MTDVSTPILVVEDTNALGSVIITLLNQAGFQNVDHVHGAVTAHANADEPLWTCDLRCLHEIHQWP